MSLYRTTPSKYIKPTMDFVMKRSDAAPIDIPTTVNQVIALWTYNDGTAHLASRWLAPSIPTSSSTATGTVKVYDLDGHLDGSPVGAAVYDQDFGLSIAATTFGPLPDETAICVSFQADITGLPEFVGDTRPAARMRGRNYVGPLNTSVMAADANGDPIVNNTTQIGLADAWVTELVAQTPPKANLQVWSRKNEAVTPVLDVWVNSLFDTRRRRGARRVGSKYFGT